MNLYFIIFKAMCCVQQDECSDTEAHSSVVQQFSSNSLKALCDRKQESFTARSVIKVMLFDSFSPKCFYCLWRCSLPGGCASYSNMLRWWRQSPLPFTKICDLLFCMFLISFRFVYAIVLAIVSRYGIFLRSLFFSFLIPKDGIFLRLFP